MAVNSEVILYTDGACIGNPGPGGWAALLQMPPHEKVIKGADPQTTNNRMELMAVIMGLKALKRPCTVKVVTDSKYVMNAFTQGWLKNWIKNDWKTSNKKSAVKNKELWQDLQELVDVHTVSWEWVKGHSGHRENEIVDSEARSEAERVSSS